MFKSTRPPLAYYGGKQRMAKNIIPLIPQHTTYVEPFCGGATILFKKPWPKVTNTQDYREVINDKDENLINFFKILQSNGKELCEYLELCPYSEQLNKEFKSKNFHKMSNLERAAAYWYNTQTSFAKKMDSGFGRSMFGANQATIYRKKVVSLHEYINRIMQVVIMNTSAIEVIKKWDSPQSFFYCDPPYPETNQEGYEHKFDSKEFQELVDTLENCQGSFILSCYELEGIKIPESWEKFQFKAINSSAGSVNVSKEKKHERNGIERVETVYRRFNKVNVRPEIQKLYNSGKFDCYVSKLKGEK